MSWGLLGPEKGSVKGHTLKRLRKREVCEERQMPEQYCSIPVAVLLHPYSPSPPFCTACIATEQGAYAAMLWRSAMLCIINVSECTTHGCYACGITSEAMRPDIPPEVGEGNQGW